MENMANLPINTFLDKLGSSDPAPGGGAVAALCGGLGTALTSMVANFTVGRKKYLLHDELMKTILSDLAQVRSELESSIEKDAQVFTSVTDAYSLPNDSPDEKSARTAAIQKSLKEATLVPFEVMVLCKSGLSISAKAMGKSNTNVITDLGAAALLFNAAIKASMLNVLINLAAINDKDFIAEYREKSNDLLMAGEELSKEIHTHVLNEILH